MNRLIRSLARVCRENVLGEKWLVAPSYRTGNQWLETVARSGTPIVNVRVKTLRSLAVTLAGPEMVKQGVELLHHEAGPILADRAWARVAAAGASGNAGYLSRLDPGPSLARTFFATMNDLRLAGLAPGGVDAARFEVPAKGREIVRLLEAWNQVLDESGYVDHAGVLAMAAARLKAEPVCLPAGITLLLSGDAEPKRLEQELLDAFCAILGDGVHTLPVDEPGTPLPEEDGAPTDAALLRYLSDPSIAPRPHRDNTVRISRGVGEVNEVREVLRSCLAGGIPLDEVEVLHTDPDAYIPLFFETFARLAGDAPGSDVPGSDDLDTIPVTFAEGVPARYSRPGRALAGLVSWSREGFRQEILARMIQDGILRVPEVPADLDIAGESENYATLARVFRSVPILMGRERYLPGLEAAGALDSDGDSLRILRALVGNLLPLAPREGAPQKEGLENALCFLENHVRCVTHLDNLALARLKSHVRRFVRLVAREETAGIDVIQWLAELPRTVRVGGSGPRSGKLHVSGLLGGGHSGRAHTFLLGLADGRFPGGAGQDPLLLDGERRKVSPHLTTSGARLDTRAKAFECLLAGLRSTVTFSFPSHDVVEDRELFPGPVLGRVAWLLTGDRECGLDEVLPQAPASFTPDAPGKCLDVDEGWLHRLCIPGRVVLPEAVLERFYPWIGRGRHAARERASNRFTPYDGRVGPLAPGDDPLTPQGPVVSGSALELAGKCPLSYFFRRVLMIRPLDDPDPDPTQWLSPADRGMLLHEVFHLFWHDLLEKGEVPSVGAHMEPLLGLVRGKVNEARHRNPPGSEIVFEGEVKDLEKTARIFLQEEEAYAAEGRARPFCLEASIGLAPGPLPTPLDTPEPVSLTLAQGRMIRVKGRIDRIDRIETGGAFTVWDYKTGSSRHHENLEGGTRQGRVIQHGLYLDLAREVLKQKVSADARVTTSGFFFPGPRTRGTRLVFEAGEVAGWKVAASALCVVVSAGCFLATDNADKVVDDCLFCDYQAICGDLAAVHAASKRKIEKNHEHALDLVREVKDNA